MSPSPFHESISEDIVKNYNPPPGPKRKVNKEIAVNGAQVNYRRHFSKSTTQ